MSEHHHGVHMHAPHEEMVEHGAHTDSLAQRVALTTAILATIGALFGYQAGQIANESMLRKNDAIGRMTEASDQWGYYQAKSTREFIANSLSTLATDDKARDKLKADADRYSKEKEEIKKKAEELTAESRKLNEESESKVAPHERIALGVTFMQVAVALASITVLTRKLWLFAGSLAFAAVGIGVSVWGYLAQ
jgi:hypothetical protein